MDRISTVKGLEIEEQLDISKDKQPMVNTKRDLLECATAVLSGGVLLFMAFLTLIDVVGRYFLNLPIPFATEVTEIAVAVMIFLALPLVSAKEDHIVVDLFSNLLNKPLIRNVHRLSVNLLCSVCCGITAWRITILAANSYRYGDTSPYLEIPMFTVYYIIGAMMGVCGLVFLLNSISIISNFRDSAPDSEAGF